PRHDRPRLERRSGPHRSHRTRRAGQAPAGAAPAHRHRTVTALRWLLSAALAVPVGYCLLRCVGPGHAADPRRRYRLVSGAADLAMSLTMITALWTVRLDDRAGVLPAAFAATAAWYLTRAVAGHTGPSRIELLHKAVAPAAMFWMLLSTAGDPSHAAGG